MNSRNANCSLVPFVHVGPDGLVVLAAAIKKLLERVDHQHRGWIAGFKNRPDLRLCLDETHQGHDAALQLDPALPLALTVLPAMPDHDVDTPARIVRDDVADERRLATTSRGNVPS